MLVTISKSGILPADKGLRRCVHVLLGHRYHNSASAVYIQRLPATPGKIILMAWERHPRLRLRDIVARPEQRLALNLVQNTALVWNRVSCPRVRRGFFAFRL